MSKEIEKPKVVARLYEDFNGDFCASVNTDDGEGLMTIAQHERIVAALREELSQRQAVPEGWLIELGFDVLDRPSRLVDSKGHLPTIKIVLPACEVDDSSSWELRNYIAEKIGALLSEGDGQ